MPQLNRTARYRSHAVAIAASRPSAWTDRRRQQKQFFDPESSMIHTCGQKGGVDTLHGEASKRRTLSGRSRLKPHTCDLLAATHSLLGYREPAHFNIVP